MNQEHVAAVVDLVEDVDDHVVASRQGRADVVVAKVGDLAEVLNPVLREPAAHQGNVAQIEFEPVGLLARAGGRVRRAPAVPRDRVRQGRRNCGWPM